MSMSEVKVADFSHWNTGLKYSLIPSLGIYGAILRVTEKGNIKDRSFDAHVKGLKENNINIIGSYRYSYAMNINEIIAEANAVVNVLKQYPEFDGKVVFLDLEDPSQLKLGRATLMKFAAEFRRIMLENYYKFAIYCSSGLLDSIIDINAVNYDLWLAAYSYNDNGSIPAERLRPNRKGQVGWQFSSHFNIGGQNCDMSVFDKDWIDKTMNNNEPKFESGGEVVVEKDVETIDNTIESAISFMEKIANDNSHGYDQIYRWNERGDYDCSSLVITAWEQAGVPVKSSGATYTGNMYNVFLKNGFVDVTSQVNLNNGSGMKRGDVLLNHVHHVAMYCGNGMEVEASINERGGATYGTPGDQTGREILIRSYRNYPWNSILRFTNGSKGTASLLLKKGSTGAEVKLMQEMLIACGYSCGSAGADGDFGNATYNALISFQKDHGLEQDGIYGPASRASLQKAYKDSQKQYGIVLKIPGVIRTDAKKTAAEVITIGAGEKVEILGTKTNSGGILWYKVKYGDKEGYIVGKNLKVAD